jgi:hypothetical protein
MKLRTLVITVAFLALLSAAVYLRNRPAAPESVDARVGQAVLPADVVDRATGLMVSDQGKQVQVARGADGIWRVGSYFNLPADFSKISQLVQDLNQAKVERLVTDSPDRLSRMEFKDSFIRLTDAGGKELWKLTLGKAPENGNGRFIRFGDEPRAYFAPLHVWLDNDAKGWADAALPVAKPEEIAKLEIPLPSGPVTAARTKAGEPWTAAAPAGEKLDSDKVNALVTTLTGLRFSDTVPATDPVVADARAHQLTYTLTTFGGQTIRVALGRRPEVKKLKAPAAHAATPIAKTADGKIDTKPVEPEYDVTPAGPVVATIASSDPKAPVNALMAARAFEVDEYTYTALPQKADDLFVKAPAVTPTPPRPAPAAK